MSGNTGWKSNSQKIAEKYGPPPKRDAKPSYMPVSQTAPRIIEHIPSIDFAASDTSGLQPGQKVEHQKFGFGDVLKMEGELLHLIE